MKTIVWFRSSFNRCSIDFLGVILIGSKVAQSRFKSRLRYLFFPAFNNFATDRNHIPQKIVANAFFLVFVKVESVN